MLENKLGITDSTELARMEEKISKQKAVEMFENGFFETLECKRLIFRYDRKNPRLLFSSRSTLTIHI